MKILQVMAICATLMPLPALAQASVSAESAASVDQTRLAMARKLIDQISPPEKRNSMIEGIIRPMMANMRRSFEESPEFAQLFAKQPAARAQMLKFMTDETEHSLSIARESMPGLFDAMAIAYARRFSTEQLTDLAHFFETPTGRVYAEQAATIMSDPAVMAAQRAMMAKAFDGLQDRVKEMAKKIEAASDSGPS